MSSFIIQFFVFPILGGLILAGFLLAIQHLTATLFRLAHFDWLYSFLPPLFMVMALIWLRYFMYDLLSPSERYAVFPGAVIALAIPLIYRGGKTFAARAIRGLALLLVLYPLAAFYAVWGGLLCLVPELEHREPKPERKLRLEVIVLAILAAPLLWYAWFYPTIPFSRIHVHGFIPGQSDNKDFFFYLIPYILFQVLAFGTFLFLLVRHRHARAVPVETVAAPVETVAAPVEAVATPVETVTAESTSIERARSGDRAGWLVFAVMLVMTGLCSYHPDYFFATLATHRALEEQDWDRIVELDRRCRKPARTTIMVRNLALFEKDALADEVFRWPQSGPIVMSLVKVSTYRVYGDRILYRYGMVNYAAKIAMNKMVSMPNSAGVTKLSVQVALVQGRYEVARRYLKRLEKTLVHRSWARKYRDWLDDCDRKRGALPERAREIDPANVALVQKEIDLIRSRGPGEDYFTDVLLPEFFVMELGQHGGFAKLSRPMQELSLVGSLLTYSKSGFMNNIETYIAGLKGRRMPRSIEEAYLLYLYADTKTIAPPKYDWTPVVVEDFKRYLTIASREQRMRTDASVEFEKECPNTFWAYSSSVKSVFYY